MEHFCRFVSSRGILRSTDVHTLSPRSSYDALDASIFENLSTGDSIYVCTDGLINFVNNVLPGIKVDFSLVTGDSDVAVSAAMCEQPHITYLLSHPRLIAWHAQNLEASHPKLYPIPIGNDYHTMWESQGMWGISRVSPIAQENVLFDILHRSPAFEHKYPLAYCNWHFAVDRGDRAECMGTIDRTACYFEQHRLPRRSTWARQAEFMYVISPEGAGLDCHRTWEALMLGLVPVVKHNSLAALLEGLPVLFINRWSEVTPQLLLEHARDTLHASYDFNPLFLSYWTERIRGRAFRGIPSMSKSEFRALLTSSRE